MFDVDLHVSYQPWYLDYVLPIIRAGNAGDAAGYAEARAAAEAACSDPAFDSDTHCALQLLLSYTALGYALRQGDPALLPPAYLAARAAFDKCPPQGEASTQVHRLYLLQLRIVGAIHGLEPLLDTELNELLAAVPDNWRMPEHWHAISTIAFIHGRRDLVDQAYAACLTEYETYQKSFRWRRLNVMCRLLDGAATRRDAELLIAAAALPGHIREIRNLFWPRLAEAQLVDEHLSQALERRSALLAV